MNNALMIPPQQVKQMADVMAASGMFGLKSPAQAHALMLLAQAEGRHPATVAQDYHIINNRPALKADAILSRFQKNGGKVKWLEISDTIVTAQFSNEKLGVELPPLSWDIERAKKAGLLKNPTWTAYPRAMLRARLIAEAVRLADPSVFGGMYSVEEMSDVSMEEQTSHATMIPGSTTADSEPSPEEVENKRRMKYLRGKLNTALMETREAVATEDEANFRSTCTNFQREHGKEIWDCFTFHNEIETFRALADTHLERVKEKQQAELTAEEVRKDFAKRVKKCGDPIEFKALEEELEATFYLKNDPDTVSMLHEKGREDFGYTYEEDLPE